MAVQSETSSVAYVGNNSAVTPYPVTFKFFADAHLKVTVTDEDGVETVLELTTDFTVTGAGEDEGGEIVTVDAWDNTHTITIKRVMPNTQPYSYTEGQRLPAATLEENFDWIVMLAQQLSGLNGAGQPSLLFPFSEPSDSNRTLPNKSLRKDTVIAFNASTGEMEVLRMDQLAQRLLVILGAEAVLPYRSREVTSTAYELDPEDLNTGLRFNTSGSAVITLPESDEFPENFFAGVSRFGAGSVEFVAAPGVIIESDSDQVRVFGQKTHVAIQLIGENRWWIYGDLY